MNSLPAFDAHFELADVIPFDTSRLRARHSALEVFHQQLGDTDLIEVPGYAGGAAIVAKLEWQNPAGSIKDRVAYALLCDALMKHDDRPLDELRILEYSGGNLAGALSMLCGELGIAARFVLSSAAPGSLLELLRARGASIELVDRELGFYPVIQRALEMAARDPSWTLLYQHRNTVNIDVHTQTTGAELVSQLGDRVPSAWVASIGTGGSLVGVARALDVHYPSLRVVGVTPAELPYGSAAPPNGLPKYSGSGGMGNRVCQPFVQAYRRAVEHHSVSFADSLKGMVEFRQLTGIAIGSSAAANWLIARELARELPREATVVTLFPDAGTPEEWKRALS
ncbi:MULTISPECIES: pyridoxal-phosphate dependent enzyme [Paraburkholderia]|uniref:pyridoxal-phosphate dependent enzyme n=1 Tax=Paraburkholderia TaxID=1822464 RepID=UPI00224F3496|nr:MULTISPECIES: pyridoxal-phosphate dependent enzyme [Paraburkholderia]MCX4162802.1 pyridoxal-phosphate dependent enzyme [Paraburkholderia megapolitana]MDN7158297.1 pyridoxal-phosphate dependent enzyme [Paraburkholderia sp. CHISQ3]MDQ6495344.1 pyridoxal-phosphate dependent enzyme [Paraburkholderia megapolitana]